MFLAAPEAWICLWQADSLLAGKAAAQSPLTKLLPNFSHKAISPPAWSSAAAAAILRWIRHLSLLGCRKGCSTQPNPNRDW